MPQYAPEEAIRLYRAAMQEVVGEIMGVMESRAPGLDRLCDGLERYWEGWFARRELRRAAYDSTRGTSFEHSVEPMGRPFLVMVRGELLQDGVRNADRLAQWIYDESRAIATAEADGDERAPERRAKMLALLRADAAG
ncbi:MAG TPA: hypothetical protein VLI06_19035 [Solimonas sp.]|nr:hypothetical protein [Solimonas sp.]